MKLVKAGTNSFQKEHSMSILMELWTLNSFPHARDYMQSSSPLPD
ncbi:MAG: hypothetical protein WB014_00425 [Methanosarcina sp.]